MPLSPGAAALIARMSPAPNPSRAMLIASTYDRMASRSYWAKLDVLYVMAAHDSQASRLNWKANEFNLTVSGTPTFLIDRGWACAFSSYLDTSFAPSTAGRNYQKDSATLLGWSVTPGAAGSDTNFLSVGLQAGVGGTTGYICPRRLTNILNGRINDALGINFSNTTTDGMFSARRNAATNRQIDRNGAPLASNAQASTSIQAGNLILLPGWQTVVTNLRMSAAAAGAYLNDTEIGYLYADLLPYMQSVEAVPDTIMASAAQWLSERTFEISSLDSGPINFVEPWGGSEYGHSYTFLLDGSQPAGVTIEGDTGLLSNSSTLSPGTYTFPVAVKNWKDIGKVSTFWITIAVREGVTSGRSGYQVLHKDYAVSSGTYGAPSGSDYTAVLLNIRTAILADQATEGENNLCATIVFNSGTTYQYTDNRWPFGLQRLKIRSTVAGTQASLQNSKQDLGEADVAFSPLQINRWWQSDTLATGSSWVADAAKTHAYLINTTAVGDTTVTLKTASDAANLYVGRWVVIASQDQQGSGFPANCRKHDYARVSAINGAVVTLDRKLRHAHKDNYWELLNLNSAGKARIFVIDRDSTPTTNTVRATQRLHMQDINVMISVNRTTRIAVGRNFYPAMIEGYFKNVTAPNFCVSQSRHANLDSCTIGASEFDKLTTRVAIVGGSVGVADDEGIRYASGMELVILKGTSHRGAVGWGCRQLRTINTTMQGGVTDAPLRLGSFAIEQYIARSTVFTDTPTPTFQAWSPSASGLTMTVGSNGVTYAGGVLTVPSTFPNFNVLVGTFFEGAMIYNGAEIDSPNNGVITGIRDNGSNTGVRLDVTWLNGSAPTDHSALVIPYVHECIVENTCSATGGAAINDFPSVHRCMPNMSERTFPTGYPASTYGF